MTTDVSAATVPAFDLADRLRKSLRVSDVSVQEMADYLDVNRNTVGRWINGHNEPSGAVVRLWAMRTGVPYVWLRDGESPHQDGPGGGSATVVRPPGLEPGTRWFVSGTARYAQPRAA